MLSKASFVATAFVVSSGMSVFQPGASPGPQPAIQTTPATPTIKKKEPPTLAAIFKDEAARKAMGLDKLTPEEQQRLAENIVAFAAPMRELEARASLLRQEAVKYLTRQGWEEDPIRDALDAEVIVPDDPENKAPRHAKYVPFWAGRLSSGDKVAVGDGL